MARLAVDSTGDDWIRVDHFESKHGGWMRTLQVMKHYSELLGEEKRLLLVGGSDLFISFTEMKPSGGQDWWRGYRPIQACPCGALST